MSKEQILKEFEKIDSYDLDMESQGSKTVRKIFKDFLSQAIDQTREETIKEVENILDNYFKGLIMIPMPELTLNKIKKELNKLKK